MFNFIKGSWQLCVIQIAIGCMACCSSSRPFSPLDSSAESNLITWPAYFPQHAEQKLDLLFVIDNSSGMASYQRPIASQLPRLINLLGYPLPEINLGIISSDLGAGNYNLPTCEVQGGDGGKLQAEAKYAGCFSPRNPWISLSDGQTNIPESSGDPVQDVSDAFACLANLGSGGCGFEMIMESARRALDPQLNINPGFLHPEAFLLIFFLSDEDDCSTKNPALFDPKLADSLGPSSIRCARFSMQCDADLLIPGEKHNCKAEIPSPPHDYLFPVEEYARFFTNLRPPGRVILSAIAGPADIIDVGLFDNKPVLQPVCQSPLGFAVQAIRIQTLLEHQLLQSRGDLGLFNPSGVNICGPDFRPAMDLLGQTIHNLMQGRCFHYPVLTPGGGLACSGGDELGSEVICKESCLHQVECSVEEVTNFGGTNELKTPIEKCHTALFDPHVEDCGTSCPCWRIVPRTECATGNGPAFGLEILRLGNQPASQGTVAVARCPTSELKWGSPDLLSLGQCL